eukprot:symbB.v1.2.027835.t1/scaffold2770.1/size71041/1
MTSYYDVFEVAAGVPVVAEDGTSSDLGSGWEHQSNENWSRGWSWHGDARVENENWSWEDPGSDRGSVAWSRQSDGWQRRGGAAWSGWGERLWPLLDHHRHRAMTVMAIRRPVK